MTLTGSGAISLANVNTELGRTSTAQISMSDSSLRGTFDVASGQISMSSGWGKSNIKSFSANPSSISSGSSSTLTATFYANSGSVSPAPGAITSGVGASVSPTSTTTYTLTAGGSSATTTITVTASTQGYRGSSATWSYASGTSGGGLSNPSYAYDTGTTTTVDTSTYASFYATSSGGTRAINGTVNGFASVTKTGTLKVQYLLSVTDSYEQGDGYAIITYSCNAGSGTIAEIAGDWSLGTVYSGLFTVNLSNVNLSTLSINIYITGGRALGSYSYSGNANIYDAVFIA